MKSKQFKILTAGLVAGVVLLAGCSKSPEQDKPHFDKPPAASVPSKPAPAAGSIGYYSQHLDEAKKTWHDCRAKGATNMDDVEREQCANAQSAWEMQPYKAGAKR